MVHLSKLTLLVSFASAALIACGGADAVDTDEAFTRLGQPILGGTLDTEHPEVMLLANRAGFICTGTVIHVEGQTGYLLTAAHCVTEEDDERATVPLRATDFIVIPGNDFAESTTAFGVNQVAVEPRYEGGFAQHDIAIVRFSLGGAPAPGVIPPLFASEDTLDIDDPLLFVGFGQTETNEENTQRRQVERKIEDLDAELLVYTQADARGTCFGDSGGPGLVELDGEERVAAIVSGGVDNDERCIGGIGVSTRVSGYEAFIASVLP